MSLKKPDNKDGPLVSIIIPFYNPGLFLRDSIESVFAQTVDWWELILVNDGSTDQSETTALEFAERFPNKVHFLTHDDDQNKGASASRNLGITKAKGELVTFLDSDDVFFPETLEMELKAFEENPEADAVCGSVEAWFSWSDGSEGREKDFIIGLGLDTDCLYRPPDLLVHNLRAGGRKAHPNCIMVKTGFAKELEVFAKNNAYSWEDHVAWAKLAINGKIYVLDAVLAKYRIHSESTSAFEIKSGQYAVARNFFLDWLEAYLKARVIKDENVWQAVSAFRRKADFDSRFVKLKNIYQRVFSLRTRYKIREQITRAKGALSWPTHRHK